MTELDKLKRLFQAYRDFDDSAFLRTANSIISENLASNRMSEAKELKKALGEGHKSLSPRTPSDPHLNVLPSASRHDGKLLVLKESHILPENVVFSSETKHKISRFLEEQKNKASLQRHGLRAKNKLLFWGPPGCGKTHTSFLIAHELGLPIAVVQISSLISSYLGDTATHIKKIFDYIELNPVVLLLDEFDAVGKTRDDRQDVGELKRVVNSILQAFDNFNSDRSIIIAASNHQDILDHALWRRFDDIVSFPRPSSSEICSYLKLLLRDIPIRGSISQLATAMKSLSFAEIERVSKEALKTSIISGRKDLTPKDIRSHLEQYKNDVKMARQTSFSSGKNG